MKPQPTKKTLRCAIYTRKSTEHNLDLEFNSLDAQREACEAYIKNQAHEGWRPVRGRYDDGGLSGASLDRPAIQELLGTSAAGRSTSSIPGCPVGKEVSQAMNGEANSALNGTHWNK
jgi:site-specific DNA recombinase